MPRKSKGRVDVGDTTIYPHSVSSAYYIRFSLNGNTVNQSLRTADIKSARTIARQIDDLLHTDRESEILDILDRLSPKSSSSIVPKIKFDAYVRYFCAHYTGLPDKPNSAWNSEETWRNNKTKFSEWQKFFGADTRLDRITRSKINDFLDHKAKETTTGTRNRHKSTMATFFAYAIEKGFIDHNPMDGIKSHTEEVKAPNPLTRDELARLIKELPHYSVLIITLLRSLGLRMGELQRARWDHIDWEKKTIIIEKQKNKSWRNIPLTTAAYHTLKEIYQIQKTNHKNGHTHKGAAFGDVYILNLKRINKGLTAAAKRAGLEHVKPHQMRHTFATEVWESDGKLSTLMALLGHTSPAMSLRYAKYRDQDNRNALAGIEKRDAKEASVNHPTQMQLLNE